MISASKFGPASFLFLAILVISMTGCSSESVSPVDNPNDSEVKEFGVIAKNWEFDPDTITVNKGDSVRLSVRSVDVRHGIAIPAFRVNSVLEPGSVSEIKFVADKTGTFEFSCSVQCGSGHGDMKGLLIVNE